MTRGKSEGGGRSKSWREIDAQRGKSRSHSRQDDPAQQRIERSASYEKYKKAADALFTGGELPEGLAKAFDPEGKRKAQKDARARLADLDRKAWVPAVLEYLEKYPELPEDPYFLDQLLDHPRERVVAGSLSRLEGLADEGKLKRDKCPHSLTQRLKSIELTGMDPELQSRAKALREQLEA